MAELPYLMTERLILREFREDDFEAVHAYASYPENIHFMVWGPNQEEDTRTFLKDCISHQDKKPRMQMDYAITLKNTVGDVEKPGHLIGGCGIYLNERRNSGMLGWILHKDYWKKGLTYEAGQALLRYGFEELGLHRIYATCNKDNYGSYRVMEKLGMRREAHFVKARLGRVGTEEVWYDEYHYGILKEEWENETDGRRKE